jgi:cyclophilin family peptidyl-prolyl cis-trans isomerase
MTSNGDGGGTITTNFGDIELEFYPQDAPKTVENFKQLAKRGFYNGLIFHRIVPGFVVQGGDPNTRDVNNKSKWGTGGPGWNIKAEFNKNKHSRGALSMARSQDPNSAGSQFFIVLKDSNFLDGQYTVFGRVISGMENVVDKIASLKTDSRDAPIQTDQAKIIKVTIRDEYDV